MAERPEEGRDIPQEAAPANPDATDGHADPNRVAIEFAAGMYRAVLDSQGYVDLLDIWDNKINNTPDPPRGVLELMERQVAAATPLLVDAIRNMPSGDDLVRAVDEESHPCIMVSRNGLVIAANAAASSYFSLIPGDSIDPRSFQWEGGVEFEQFFDRVALRRPLDEPLIVRIAYSDNSHRLVAVTPFRMPASRVCYMKVCGLDLAVPERAYELLASAFNLTSGERDVMRHFLDGKGATEIARERGTREDTVKKTIRSVREKTGADGRADLMRMVAGIARISGVGTSATPPVSVTNFAGRTYSLPATHSLLEVEGRRMEYVSHGSEGDFPVLLMHGSLSGVILREKLVNLLLDCGIRLIIPLRPGFGLSERLAEGSTPADTARHILAFADRLGIGRFAMLTSASGCFPSFVIQHMVPERVIAHVATATYLPADRNRLHRTMAPWVRGFMSSVGRYPQVTSFLIAGGYRFLLQKGPASFFEMLFRRSPPDRDIVRDSEILAPLAVGLPIACAQGVDTLIEEMSLVVADWSGFCPQILHPVKLIHGGYDSIFPLDLAREFAAAAPNRRIVEIPEAGQMLLYSHPERVAEELCASILESGVALR